MLGILLVVAVVAPDIVVAAVEEVVVVEIAVAVVVVAETAVAVADTVGVAVETAVSVVVAGTAEMEGHQVLVYIGVHLPAGTVAHVVVEEAVDVLVGDLLDIDLVAHQVPFSAAPLSLQPEKPPINTR